MILPPTSQISHHHNVTNITVTSIFSYKNNLKIEYGSPTAGFGPMKNFIDNTKSLELIDLTSFPIFHYIWESLTLLVGLQIKSLLQNLIRIRSE